MQVEPQRPSYDELAAMLAELRVQVDRLREDNERLQAENAELKRRLGLNSTNSSRPPSSDGLAKPGPEGKRSGGSGRRRGKQPGASGSTLKLVAEPDETLTHRPDWCANPARGADLAGAPEFARQRRQVFELPEPELWVTEHRVVAVRCGCGQVTEGVAPDGVSGRVQYGPGVKGRRGVRARRAVPAVCPGGAAVVRPAWSAGVDRVRAQRGRRGGQTAFAVLLASDGGAARGEGAAR